MKPEEEEEEVEEEEVEEEEVEEEEVEEEEKKEVPLGRVWFLSLTLLRWLRLLRSSLSRNCLSCLLEASRTEEQLLMRGRIGTGSHT